MGASFYFKEENCQRHFDTMEKVFHCVSPEDFQILFTDCQEFADAMLILAVCCKLCKNIKMITFQLMSNHIHFVVCGEKGDVEAFIDLFEKRIFKYLLYRGRTYDYDKFHIKIFPIDDLEYFRSSIAYCNRNGFVVNEDVTPFSYPWGANTCYFNPIVKQYYNQSRRPAKVIELRSVFHGKNSDATQGIYILGNCVSPFSFCDITAGERAFRDARHYFYCVSKNVESFRKIASIISESISYTDEDVYTVARNIAISQYNVKNPSLIPSSAKIEVAKALHYDYNAGNKQIQRILKLDASILNSLFSP